MVTVRVRHDVGRFSEAISAYPERWERASSEATREATQHVERYFAEEMERIAGGVYWEIDASVRGTATGTRGSVSTHKSRAHRIEPTKEHGLLVFPGASGETVFVRGGIDHPGSRPVDVLTPLRRTQPPILRGIYRDSARNVFGSPSPMPGGSL